MNILMMTNTFTPHVGGVARSVSAFTEEYRKRGHRVIVVAPEFENQPEEELDVIRMPAIQNFNGSDFSVVLPIPGFLRARLEDFHPDVVHSHHPFLIGSTAIRIANQYNIPLVFTHHTMYEQYTHYVPGDSPRMKRFVTNLTTGYANLCDEVIAPSESIARILRERGVNRPGITSIPTGVEIEAFATGDGRGFRRRHGVPEGAFTVGHLGRLAPEKNLEFLGRALVDFLGRRESAHFLLVGYGPSESPLRELFEQAGVGDRVHFTGRQSGQHLVDAYHAMDVFAFASKTETQGMVLVEAMAAGLPVVALEANGVREVVRDGANGRLLMEEDEEGFAAALADLAGAGPETWERLKREASSTARHFSKQSCAQRVLDLYEKRLRRTLERPTDIHFWEQAREQIKTEWELLSQKTEAVINTLKPDGIGD